MTQHETSNGELPLAGRDAAHLPGHWLLARLGKRVLRPGGRELTERMLADASIQGADVVELAPGLGKTAKEIISRGPKSYVGVEADESAAKLTQNAIGSAGTIVEGQAEATGRPDASADLVVGEAMLTMQTDKHKAEIVREVARILRPGGRYAIHEMGLTPEGVSDEVKTEVRQALARAIKVNARPLTQDEWMQLLTDNGFEIEHTGTAPMALLEPKRILADEGLPGTLRFAGNVIRDSEARARVLDMRRTFTKYRANMNAIEIVARKK